MKYGICRRCSREGIVEQHHIVSRKQQPALKNCTTNLIELCYQCHRGDNGAHGKNLEVIQRELKLDFQNKLYGLFKNDLINFNEIIEKLQIKEKEAFMLIRLLYPVNGAMYRREDVIRACMGGKIILEN